MTRLWIRRRRWPRQIWPTVRLLAAGTACLALPSANSGAESPARQLPLPSSQELFVEALDPTGGVITADLAPAIEVLEDGQPVSVADLGEVGSGWRVVLYLDQLLASTTDFHNAVLQLAERARELTRLGAVEVVLAGEETGSALPATTDADALSQALGWLRLRETSENLQTEVRAAFLEEIGLDPEAGEEEVQEIQRQLDLDAVTTLVETAIAREREVLRRHREQLLLWAADHVTEEPKALLLAGSGFDDESLPFYRSSLAATPWSRAAENLEPESLQPSVAELAQALAVYGWTVLPYLPEQRGDMLLEETDEEARAREEEEITDVIFQDGRLVDRTTIGFDPKEMLKRRRQRERERRARPVLLNPEEPCQRLAEITGGEIVRGQFQLSDLLQRLARRRRLVLSGEPPLTPDPRSVTMQLASAERGDLPNVGILRARRWIGDGTPESVSTVRARRILSEELDEGEIVISAALQPAERESRPRLIVKRDSLAAPGDLIGSVRVTVAVAGEDGSVEIWRQQRAGWEVRSEDDLEGEPTLEVSMEADTEGVVVVVVDELASGRWGATFASLVEPTGVTAARDRYDALLLPAPKVIHLVAPAQGFAMGQTPFETVVSTGEVARVDFYLDGEQKAIRRSPPFAATLDLGALPQPRRVEVVAMDDAGAELGRDYLIVNEGSGVFGVRIVRPRADLETGEVPRLTGPVDVEAEVEPRRGEGIDRVEFFWKDDRIATRYARPYRQRIVIPPENPTGFIRVVAYLEDGASSEDVLFVNSSGPSERLQVNLMELYVVVTDRKGRPVQGLRREMFRVREQDSEQEIATFSDAGDLPLTVGMVIDSSASMFVKLPEVQFAAAEFLRGLSTRRDRAFVVGFGDEPRLTRNTTSDLPAVIQSLDRLQPNGQTAIWKAMVYGLVQLQGVPGKKALVVYTDGADEDPDFSYRTCLKFARKVGVPIYVILSNNEIRRTQGKGLSVRGFLDRLEALTESVGGRVYFARVGQDLEEVYREIDEELRSQYVVGYYSRDTGGTEWRRVVVDVTSPGYDARTIAGYYR